MDQKRQYLAIDLKSFYASVECVERGLDPLNTALVVADPSRTDKTICLAVSPTLKAYGIPGRPRLFEVNRTVEQVNARRLGAAPGHAFTGASALADALRTDPALKLEPIVAPPRMARYMAVSAEVYQTYLRFVAPEDVHVYSIDEVFIDVTPYLRTYGCTARELAMRMIREVLARTGITATAGVGTNLYLCKIAMDIVAKHMPADQDGVRIAELDERSYREQLWDHKPLTDFWRVGRGIARKLASNGICTMGDLARCSLGGERDRWNEELLYKLFGVNAELLIDHAWGVEPCAMADVKAYRSEEKSLSVGQVLQRPYRFEEARLIVCEMAESLVLDLVKQGLVSDQIVLSVGYDVENLRDPEKRAAYQGQLARDGYGRTLPQGVHGSQNLGRHTASTRRITKAAALLFERIADPALSVRRITIAANRVRCERDLAAEPRQLSLFTDPETDAAQEAAEARERRRQEAILSIREKYGKNAVFKAMDLQEAATARERNEQVGGHKA